MGYRIGRRTVFGFCLAAAATAPLAYRAVSGEWPSMMRRRGRRAGRAKLTNGGIHVRESIRLEKPLDEVFRFWRQPENLPRVMSCLEQVIEQTDRRSHWIGRGPSGQRVEWDAEIVNEMENAAIAWRSLAGSAVVTLGSVNFSTVRKGSTEVSVDLHYARPAQRAGGFLAGIVGRKPSQTIREDLRRLKRILEAGEMHRSTSAGLETGG
jgi:uncharacterized membrane protein